MRDKLTLLKVGNFVRNNNLFALNSIETIPEANDVVNRSSDALVLLVNVKSDHISSVGTFAFFEL